jgi:L-ascorbate metabolism protein UlaG (beta-lactamase superfamily)
MDRSRRAAALLLALALLASLSAPAPAGAEGVRVRWLGVAGFAIESGPDTLLHDPYLSRPGLLRTIFRRYAPDPRVLEPLLAPGGRAPELGRGDLVLIGHSHFDHLGDAPWIAERTGATLVGSGTTVAIARGFGLGEAQVRRADPGDRLEHGAFEVRVVESRHARIFFGREPLPGTLDEPPAWPLHALAFKLGDARGYLVTHRPSGLRIFLLSSANLHRPALDALAAEGVRVDALLTSTEGRGEGFARALLETLRPRLVVPNHFDDFFVPLSAPDPGAPRDEDDLFAFEAEVREAAAALGLDVQVRRPVLFQAIELSPIR